MMSDEEKKTQSRHENGQKRFNPLEAILGQYAKAADERAAQAKDGVFEGLTRDQIKDKESGGRGGR